MVGVFRICRWHCDSLYVRCDAVTLCVSRCDAVTLCTSRCDIAALCVPQNLLVTGDLQVTCVSAVDEHILLGTNTGSVYWYDTVGCTMQRYRAEVSTASHGT